MTPPARVVVFTDGAAKGNPGPGGWGAVVWIDGAAVRELGDAGGATTNNRMELVAPAAALEWLAESGGETPEISVITDSTYVVRGITGWIGDWKRRGWKTAGGDDVANRDLWERLEKAVRACSPVRWERVPGHAGIPGNERADAIASAFAEGRDVSLYQGPYEGYPHDLSDTTPRGGNRKGAAAKSRSRGGKAHSYVSVVDGVVQTHATWGDCERRVRGRSGARYRKALSKADEKALVAEWGGRLDDPGAGR